MMEYKKCDICSGTYPAEKHNFEECYSLDIEWDLKQMDKVEYVIRIQSWYRGNSYRRKINRVSDGLSVSIVKEMLINYKTYVDKSSSISARCGLRYKNIRGLNFPSEISENLVRFAINKKYRCINCVWDIRKGDLTFSLGCITYIIEVKAFSSTGPSSFGPIESWDWIYFIDCRNNHDLLFKIYEIRLANNSKIWKNIKVNKMETYHQQCMEKRRPRICFSSMLKQIPCDKYSVIFDGHISQL